MIVTSGEMRIIESNSGMTTDELMELAGTRAAATIRPLLNVDDRIVILVGKGNNGGDGYVIARQLSGFCVHVVQAEGKPVTPEAMHAYKKMDPKLLVTKHPENFMLHATIFIDCVYGFGYHGELNEDIRELFRIVNRSSARVFSIDLNSGSEADTGSFDPDTIRSDITFALQERKTVHALYKDNGLCKTYEVIPLFPDPGCVKGLAVMNEDLFFAHFPKKQLNAYKGTYGKCTLISGSYGMAGAACLNILGAKTVGAPYINAVCPDDIYRIVASRFITPVFSPFCETNMYSQIEHLLYDTAAIAFGSGAARMPKKDEILDLVLQSADYPVVLDAEAIRLLVHNYYILKFVKEPVILTPHIGEFATLLGKSVDEIRRAGTTYAASFAKEYNVWVVQKGANTIVAGPQGELYINESGNPALAQAGSGDLLTGILTAMLAMVTDVYSAIRMAVWLHGYLSDLGCENSSVQNFDLESYPSIMDKLFKKHGY